MRKEYQVLRNALSFISILIMMFGSTSASSQNNFNGGFEIIFLLKNEPVGWFATRVPQANDFVVLGWDSTENHSSSYIIIN